MVRCASEAFSELVVMTMPSVTWVLQAICSLGIFSTSTRHMRQLPSTTRSGCQQKCGMSMPLARAAWMTVVPGATSNSRPLMVHFGMMLLGSYRSSSPATTLRPPMMATASASSPPAIISG